MKQTPQGADDAGLLASVAAAGLGLSWERWPDEVKDAQALAATYVSMLPIELDVQTAPWVFPPMRERRES
ncbi:hypothetical protein [Pantoea vagans]|uniref:hypothetical protein n=1 Tax=Pantoea vagans TaxID=470934 RepID=UPI0023AF1C15|nr:hypothetical protein [Pantoea vagans]MDE8559323.1 hypothetical protein [Pantoea vagans]MDE8579323.1 hypothetical protein [Pantoea vagans]